MGARGRTTEARSVADDVLDAVQIPSLPEAALQLLTLCRDTRSSANEIVRVVELDPALSAKLLRAANSAYFGQQRQVTTLTRAAVVLGNQHLRAAALGFYLTRGLAGLGHEGFSLQEFWRDAILRACLGRQMARVMDVHPAEQAFLLGLLSDIGSLIMATHFGEPYVDVYTSDREDFSRRIETERGMFNTDHGEIARALAARWGFPDLLVTCMGHRCAAPPLSRTTSVETALLQLAYFVAAVPFSTDRQTAKLKSSLRRLAVSAFGVSFEGLGEVFTVAVEQFNILRNVFSSVSPAECDADSLLEEASRLLETIDAAVVGTVAAKPRLAT